MTTAQLDHLKRIITLLDNLLDIAAKRTPGKWTTMEISHSDCLRLFAGNYYLGVIGNSDAEKLQIQQDAAYIAACSGNTEAGWRATRVAVKWFLEWDKTSQYSDLAEPILAAFPLELLTPQPA